MIPWLCLLLAVCGAVLYLAAANAKAAELGRISFAVGLFWTAALCAGKLIMRAGPVLVIAFVAVACATLERAVAPAPGATCKPFEVECTDEWGSCCPPVHECRAPIPSEGRGPFCANVDDARNWSTLGARRAVPRTPKELR